MKICYKHIRLFVVRDPANSSRTTLAAAITITHDKRTMEDPRTKDSGYVNSTVTFTVFLVPCQMLCLVSQIVTRAIASNAFETSFNSLDEILNRPNLEHTDCLPIPWKEKMLDQEVFPINYHQYLSAWHRLWLVAGNRDIQRPYSLRVGAGGKLDGNIHPLTIIYFYRLTLDILGPLTPALRSHFMANSEKVFQQNYLPQHIRKEIMPIVFGPEAAGANEQLHGMLRRATLKRDQNAPLYPTIDEIKSLEKRRDMQELKQRYITARDDRGRKHPDTTRAFVAYAHLRKELARLVVEDKRHKYFAEVDKRRALGQSTSDLSVKTAKLWKPHTRTATSDRIATHIGRFLHQQNLGGQRRAQVFSQLLLLYMKDQGTEVKAMVDSLEDLKPQQAANQEPETWTCLLCLARFAFRGGLTRHNANAHFKKGAFDQPFSCPECDRLGQEKHIVEGVEQWSNHVERYHGIWYTPCLPSRNCQRNVGSAKPRPTKTRSARCLICEGMFYPGNSFSRHFNKEHGTLFQERFSCPECYRQGNGEVTIESRAAWMDHVAEVHKLDGQTMAEITEPEKILGKRKREGNEERGRKRR
ncbi:hypothetical protein VTI28DRAFT_5494 [Corynascus sepedonium]